MQLQQGILSSSAQNFAADIRCGAELGPAWSWFSLALAEAVAPEVIEKMAPRTG